MRCHRFCDRFCGRYCLRIPGFLTRWVNMRMRLIIQLPYAADRSSVFLRMRRMKISPKACVTKSIWMDQDLQTRLPAFSIGIVSFHVAICSSVWEHDACLFDLVPPKVRESFFVLLRPFLLTKAWVFYRSITVISCSLLTFSIVLWWYVAVKALIHNVRDFSQMDGATEESGEILADIMVWKCQVIIKTFS